MKTKQRQTNCEEAAKQEGRSEVSNDEEECPQVQWQIARDPRDTRDDLA